MVISRCCSVVEGGGARLVGEIGLEDLVGDRLVAPGLHGLVFDEDQVLAGWDLIPASGDTGRQGLGLITIQAPRCGGVAQVVVHSELVVVLVLELPARDARPRVLDALPVGADRDGAQR